MKEIGGVTPVAFSETAKEPFGLSAGTSDLSSPDIRNQIFRSLS
jgi:hypothetical protein